MPAKTERYLLVVIGDVEPLTCGEML